MENYQIAGRIGEGAHGLVLDAYHIMVTHNVNSMSIFGPISIVHVCKPLLQFADETSCGVEENLIKAIGTRRRSDQSIKRNQEHAGA